MLRTPQFYVLYAMFVMMATGGLLVTANAGPMAGSWGIPAAALALATSLNAAGQRRQPDLLGLGVGPRPAASWRWGSRSCCRRSAWCWC